MWLVALMAVFGLGVQAQTTTLLEYGTESSPWSTETLAEWTAGGSPEIVGLGAVNQMTGEPVDPINYYVQISGGNGSYATSITTAPEENAIINVKAVWRAASSTGRAFEKGNGSYFRFGNIIVVQNDQDKKHGYGFAGLDNIGSVTTFTAGSYRVAVGSSTWLLIEMEINTASNTLNTFTIKSEDGATTYASAEGVVLGNPDYTTVAFGYKKGSSVSTTNTEHLRTLVVTQTKQVVETADYTVKYVCDGNEVKDASVRTGVVGQDISLTDADLQNFYSADGEHKYIYESNDAEGKTIAEGTVVTVTFREAEKYNWTAKSNVGNYSISGVTFEGDKANVKYPLYVLDNDALWTKPANNKEFVQSFEVTENNQEFELTYTETDITGVVYYAEMEDVEGMTVYAAGNAEARCSQRAVGYSASGKTQFTKLGWGKYKMVAQFYSPTSAGGKFNFFAGNRHIWEVTTENNNTTLANSEDFVIAKDTPILLGQGYYSQAVDFVYIQQLVDPDDDEVAAAEAADAKADRVFGIVGDLTGGWDEDLVMTQGTGEGQEDIYTATVTGFSVKELKGFEYKLRQDKKWDGYQIPSNSDNQTWTPEKTGVYTLTFTADVANNTLEIAAERTGNVTYTAQFVNSDNWEEVYVWAWRSDKNYTGGTWPGQKINGTDGLYTWSYVATEGEAGPEFIIFNAGEGKPQTADLPFEDGMKFEWPKSVFTNLIVNADLTGDTGWDTTGTKGYHSVGGVVTASNDAQFDFKQTIANLPAGKYKMTAQAAYRFGGDEQAEYDAIQAGTTTKLASLYATVGSKTTNVLVQNRWDGASDTNLYEGDGGVSVVNGKYVPNSTAAMKAWFTAGKYVNELEFNVPADGDVTIGIVKTAKPGADYTAIGPWTLTRIGDAEAEPISEVIDMTSFIVNPSFETGDLTGWTVGSSSDTGVRENSNGTYTTIGCDGNYVFNTWWQGIPITQTVANLPNGKYELKALMTSDAGDHLYLLANGEHSDVFGSPEGKGVFVEQSMQFNVTDNTATIGAIGGNEDGSFNENGYFWYKVDNFRLYWLDANLAELVAAYESALNSAQNVSGDMNKDVKEALDAAINAEVDKTDAKALLAATTALVEATNAANASIAAYTSAADKLAKMKELTESTNVYTQDAYDAYYGQWVQKYEGKTLTTAEGNALQNPFIVTGWRDRNTVDDLLMSTWGVAPEAWADLHVNTWSSEATEGDVKFEVPFMEYWTSSGYLAEKTMTATIEGLAPGTYEVSALVRVQQKEDQEINGVTMQVNDGTAVAITGNNVNANEHLYMDSYTATGVVGEDGKLLIKFIVASDNNLAWVAFKNVKFVKQNVEPEANYYIVGNMTGWAVSEDYKMTLNEGANTTEYMFTTNLTTTSQFKVVKVEGETQTWIPDGMGNAFGENGEIAEDGNYTIYFRPNADGGSDWFYNVIYALKNTSVGISKIEAEALKGNVYNLNGQKVNKIQKGLYIVNGKKTVVRK